jgi:hypothetical protein
MISANCPMPLGRRSASIGERWFHRVAGKLPADPLAFLRRCDLWMRALLIVL